MSLSGGDLTTPARAWAWLGNTGTVDPMMARLVPAMSNLIYGKLNRARLYNQTFTRTLDGQGTFQLVLPDYPVTAITKVQMGGALVNPSPLPNPTTGIIPPPNFGYGYRVVLWDGSLPGDVSVMEFNNGVWLPGKQNIQVTYSAGYAELNEAWTVPNPPNVTVLQPQGVWCKDLGVTYASSGAALVSTATNPPPTGSYNPPSDANPGAYVFAIGDEAASVLISYAFVPADLEDACCQMVAERYSYRSRVGAESKSLGGQETMRWMRGGNPRQMFPDLPPEVEAAIWPYVSVIPPAIGAPL